MKPTPHVHAELIKQWADAPEWWDVYFFVNDLSEWQLVTNPNWFDDDKYKLEKSAKHPDNIKPNKKLIDWSKMPRGTMTNFGELLSVKGIAKVLNPNTGFGLSGKIGVDLVRLENLRLAEQTEFTYWGGGECPVPEGVMVEVVIRRDDKLKKVGTDFIWFRDLILDNEIIAYRITALADGWTDNPKDAA
jgi:hypothetical protein